MNAIIRFQCKLFFCHLCSIISFLPISLSLSLFSRTSTRHLMYYVHSLVFLVWLAKHNMNYTRRAKPFTSHLISISLFHQFADTGIVKWWNIINNKRRNNNDIRRIVNENDRPKLNRCRIFLQTERENTAKLFSWSKMSCLRVFSAQTPSLCTHAQLALSVSIMGR